MKKEYIETRAKTTKKNMNYRFDKVVTLYSYGAAFGLVVYMLASLYGWFVGIMWELPTILSSGWLTPESMQIKKNVLHTIAFTIILIKAYMVLMSYAKTKHLNPKFLLEIGIIAPIIELVFNITGYEPWMAIFMGSFAVSLTIIYLSFYTTLREVSDDHDGIHGESI